MLNQFVLDKMDVEELNRYNLLRDWYWQSNDELEFKKEDITFDTGNLTVGDLARIKDVRFTAMQVFEDKMREKYSNVK